ncbi:MAG: GNAT family N-acetyltransferase [Oscillospiraceae bacterium]|nr:GNAT family N-acetyltransferase [Oscillospiraceae bacterium]
MNIVDFTYSHIPEAASLAHANYDEERNSVPALPPVTKIPDLTPYAENGLGVAAFEGNRMLGFLCCVSPFKNAFGSTEAVGVFSPMGANGAIRVNRSEIYARMYQAAGKKWANAGVSSHAVCLYAHDRETQEQFFRYGFGMRCVDTIREMNDITAPSCAGYSFSELTHDEFPQILPLEHMLDAHMAASPTFMLRPSETPDSFMKQAEYFHSAYFVAKNNDRIVAYIRAELDGETFICDTPGYIHVKGAYCLQEHRGKGLNQKLLSLLIQKFKTSYTRLGVDYESINPTAYGFWRKYFTAYTHSVVRRIDENVLNS